MEHFERFLIEGEKEQYAFRSPKVTTLLDSNFWNFAPEKTINPLSSAAYLQNEIKEGSRKSYPAEHISTSSTQEEWGTARKLEQRHIDPGLKKEGILSRRWFNFRRGKFRKNLWSYTGDPEQRWLKRAFGLESALIFRRKDKGLLKSSEKENRIRLETQTAGLEEYSKFQISRIRKPSSMRIRIERSPII